MLLDTLENNPLEHRKTVREIYRENLCQGDQVQMQFAVLPAPASKKEFFPTCTKRTPTSSTNITVPPNIIAMTRHSARILKLPQQSLRIFHETVNLFECLENRKRRHTRRNLSVLKIPTNWSTLVTCASSSMK